MSCCLDTRSSDKLSLIFSIADFLMLVQPWQGAVLIQMSVKATYLQTVSSFPADRTGSNKRVKSDMPVTLTLWKQRNCLSGPRLNSQQTELETINIDDSSNMFPHK